MPEEEPVSCWIEQLKAGDQTAAAHVWNHFYARLIGLVCRKLRGSPRRAVDEEDVVLSAFDTFFRRARDGQFPRLSDRDDLWHLLVKITERKALNQLRFQMRQKRGGGKIRGESVFLDVSATTGAPGLDQVVGAEPTPAFAAVVAEDFRRLLDLLADEELREIALLKLEGHTNGQIAAKTGRSVPSVERRLKLIRDKWKQEYGTYRSDD
jgi:DNA-directed RNA polymerase specialized sigma24 family protein